MKNKNRAIVFQIMIITFMFLFSWLINLSEMVRNFIYGNIFLKLIVTLVPIMFYYNMGKGMTKRYNRKFDFFTGSTIFIIAIILGVIAFIGTKMKIFSIPVASSIWRLPLDIWLYPEMYIFEVWGIKHNLITFAFSTIFPSLVFGFGLKTSRKRFEKRRKIQKMRAKRRR